jgi:peptidyl-prolyl cis-trans isomerase B (cyclophilin B)
MQSAGSGMTVNGFAVPKSGKVTAQVAQPPGTRIGGGGSADGTQQSGAPGLYQGSGVPVDPNAPDPVATINTSRGTIQFKMFRRFAPKTVDSFMDLAGRGFYNGLIFHRVEPGFCIQGGCPSGTGTGVYIDPQTHAARFLPLEASPSLRHNAAGVVAMAHMQSLDSGSCQFYITLSPQPSLDDKYTVFGGVISGMNVVNSIQKGDKIMSITVSP